MLTDAVINHHKQVLDKLPGLVVDTIKENIQIDGIQQLSRSDFQTMLHDALNEHETRYATQQLATMKNTSISVSDVNEWCDDKGYRRWNWGGQMGRPVPKSWSFPKGIKVKAAVDLFVLGIAAEKIIPFQYCTSHQFDRKDQQYFLRAHYIFNTIKKTAAEKLLVANEDNFKSISISGWDGIFDSVFMDLVTIINTHKHLFGNGNQLTRPETLSFVTFYDYLKTANTA